MLNHATYCGRLTKDVVLQKVNVGSQQRSVCRFDIAVERDRKDKNGEYVADYFKCEVWGNSADYLANYAGKGTMVTVEGRTETNTYTSKTGQNVKDYILCRSDRYQKSKVKRRGEIPSFYLQELWKGKLLCSGGETRDVTSSMKERSIWPVFTLVMCRSRIFSLTKN